MSLLKRIEQGHGSNSPAGPGEADKSRLLAMQARRVAPPGVAAQKDTYLDLKTRVQNRLFAELDPTMDVTAVNEVRATILELFEQVLAEESTVLSRPEKHRLFEQIVAEIIGFGPLQPLLEDETITEIMVNGAKNIYIERAGKIHRVPTPSRATTTYAHHRAHRGAPGPAHRRIQPVCGRPPAGRLACQRRHPAHLAGRAGAHHPQVRQEPHHPRPARPVRHDHPRGAAVLEGLRGIALEHHHLGRHRLRQDHLPEHPVASSRPTSASSPSRTPPSSSSARSTSSRWSRARPISKAAARSPSGPWWSTPCVCAPTASSWVRSAMRPPWTCSRP
jgi:hypothetical protein